MSSGHCLRLVFPDIRLQNVLLPSPLKWSLSLCGKVDGVYDIDVLFVTVALLLNNLDSLEFLLPILL